MAETHRLAPGTAVAEFVVGDLLGEGGFGTVYRARGPGGDAVAIKIFKQEATTQLLATQQNEIEALFRLNHPSLVAVKRHGYLPGGGLWLAMELVEGEPLNQYLRRRGRLETIEAIQIVRRVAEAVAHCHDLNIVHLDLKPQNIILVDPHEPRVKVLDFGLAQIEGSWKPTDSRVRAGTIAYMAPEVLARTAATPNARVDLHAVGIIFYELLAGRLPFEFASVGELIERKQAGDIVPLRQVAPEIPEAVERVVHRLLATDPGTRPGNAAWLAAHLKDLYFMTLGGGDPSMVAAVPPDAVVTPDDVPMLGRRAELDQLRSAFAAVLRGDGRAIVLAAEAGLGKSRLVSEFLNDPSLPTGALIAYGRCRGLEGLAAYSPLREALGQLARSVVEAPGKNGRALRQAAARSAAGDAALLCELIPEFRQLVNPAAVEEAAVRLMAAPQVSRAIRRVLSGIGKARPVVFVLEDLDRADEGTLDVLAHLVDPVAPPGVLLLWTSRTDDRLPAGAAIDRLALAPFDAPTNREHLGRLVPGATPEMLDRLERAIPMLSAGNPLFNTQVLRNLEMEGHLSRTAAGELVLASEEASEYTPPESISVALRRTLARLNPDVLEVLSVAALFGSQFVVSDVIELGLFPEDRVEHALNEAARQYLCHRDAGTCVFVHESIREHLEAMAVPERLPELHQRIAGQLQRRGVSPATLAYHLERAGSLAAASRFELAAGLEYDALHDPVGACRHLQHALDVLTHLPPAVVRDGLVVRTAHELSRIGCLARTTAEALADLDRCAALLETTDPEHAIVIKAAYARVFYAQGDFRSAVTNSRECLALIEQHPEHSSYACVPTNILGRVLIASGRPRAALPLLTRGCDLARSAGEHVELAHSEGVLSVALAHSGDYRQAEQYVVSCEQLATRLGDPLRLAGAYFYYSVLAEARFDWDMGVKYTTRLLSYAEEHRIGGLYMLMGTMYAGRHQFHHGRLHRAELLLVNALNLSGLVGISMGVGWTHAFLGDVHFVAGRIVQAREWYQKGLDVGNKGGDEYAAGLSLIGQAQCAAEAHQDSDVRPLAEEAIHRLYEAGLHSVVAHALQRYAEALDAIGDADGAALARARELAQFERLGLAPCAWRPRVTEEPGLAWAIGGPSGLTSTTAPGSTPDGSSGADASEDRPTAGSPQQSLLDALSTIDGFVPPFASATDHV